MSYSALLFANSVSIVNGRGIINRRFVNFRRKIEIQHQGLWDAAVLGSSALQAAVHGLLEDEVSSYMGEDTPLFATDDRA